MRPELHLRGSQPDRRQEVGDPPPRVGQWKQEEPAIRRGEPRSVGKVVELRLEVAHCSVRQVRMIGQPQPEHVVRRQRCAYCQSRSVTVGNHRRQLGVGHPAPAAVEELASRHVAPAGQGDRPDRAEGGVSGAGGGHGYASSVATCHCLERLRRRHGQPDVAHFARLPEKSSQPQQRRELRLGRIRTGKRRRDPHRVGLRQATEPVEQSGRGVRRRHRVAHQHGNDGLTPGALGEGGLQSAALESVPGRQLNHRELRPSNSR